MKLFNPLVFCVNVNIKLILKCVVLSHSRFGAFLYECHLSFKSKIPYAVSFTKGKCEKGVSNLFAIHRSFGNNDLVVEFSVCVSPLHSKFNNASQLIEFVEVNRLFGGDRFIFYNYSIGPEVDRVLRHYEHTKVADVIQWGLPNVKGYFSSRLVDAHYYGQLAAINDCLYRNIYRSDFLAFIDLDEYLVPTHFKAWNEIIEFTKGTSTKRDNQLCAFIFQNAFFRLDWQLDPKTSANDTIKRFHLTTLQVTKREHRILPHGYRSKYILDTRHADIAGIHFPWSCLNVAQDQIEDSLVNVDMQHGLLHHYRRWDDSLEKQSDGVQDRAMHKYANDIMHRVSLRYLKLLEEDHS